MDILDHLLNHDARSTRQLLALCQALTEPQWQMAFEFGQGSLYGTFDHLLDSQEYWTALMSGQPGPFVPAPSDPARSLDSLVLRFEAISPIFVALARMLRDEVRLEDTFVDTETGPARRTYGACLVHVAMHSAHHRAQVRVMFDLLGVEYNPFSGAALDAYPLESGA